MLILGGGVLHRKHLPLRSGLQSDLPGGVNAGMLEFTLTIPDAQIGLNVGKYTIH